MKAEKIFFYLLIFCLPFQIRKILWQSSSVFNEWESIFFYGTDILLALLLLFWIFRGGLKKIKIGKTMRLSIFLLLGTTALSLLKTESISIGLYQWLKLVEFILLFLYLQQNFKIAYSSKRIFQILIASALFQSVIGVLQFARQASLGLKILGESPLAPDIAGVAKFLVGGVKIIRAYGTFPHPSILASFLVLALFGLVYLLSVKRKINPLFIILYSLFVWLILVGLFLTFSRIIIIVGILAAIVYLVFVVRKKKLVFLFIVLCLLLVVLLWPMLSIRFTTDLANTQAVDLRIFYNKAAWQMIKSSPLIGIGWGGFTHYSLLITQGLPSWAYQPVHNIYLLVASQAGILGLLAFLGLLGVIIKRAIGYFKQTRNKEIFPLLFVLGFFLIIGFFDHFLLTSQQGQLMFWLVLGMLAGYDRDKRP